MQKHKYCVKIQVQFAALVHTALKYSCAKAQPLIFVSALASIVILIYCRGTFARGAVTWGYIEPIFEIPILLGTDGNKIDLRATQIPGMNRAKQVLLHNKIILL